MDGERPLTVPVRFVLMNFYEGSRAPLDDDNMAKPIRDALSGLVYEDDRQISHAEASQQTSTVCFRSAGLRWSSFEAFHRGKEFVYVRIETAPPHTELPK